MDQISLTDILRHWNIEFVTEHPEVPLAGSPERSLSRTVVEDSTGRRLVLEQLKPSTLARKREIAATLDYLARQRLAGVHPYFRGTDGDFIVKAAGGFWQLSPFIDSVDLSRPGYTREAWRGKVLAQFLIEMKGSAADIPFGRPGRPFSIAEFTRDLMARMSRHDPERATVVQGVFACLEQRFFPVHDRQPVCFCHGDPHPVNVLWGDGEIRGVIDWEFSGHKTELYDAALVLGCVGVEDPAALAGDMALAFIREIRTAGCFDESGFAVLPEFVMALRFAWLSEWLRKQDPEMVEMETDYILLLLDSQESLRRAWAV